MSRLTTPTKSTSPLQRQVDNAANELDERFSLASGMRRQINKVFPTHWSFLFGEMALYSFIILLLSGTYLALFYDPSMADVVYHGSYPNMRGVEMSRAFDTTLKLSFDIRGGLFVRQLHHWAALVFVAAIVIHLFRIFFTGAFRKPRETNWTIGILLLVLAGVDGFTGYSLPDDLLSGTGVRAALSGGMLSIPLIGTWVHWAFFGGEWATGQDVFIPRFYTLHIFIVPGLIAALIAVHLGIVWYQKHTQFPGAGKTEKNVSGVRIMPVFALHGGSLFAVTFGVLSIMAGLFQINASWNYGPYVAAQVSAGAQPDWYMGWTEGLLRLWPSWEVYLGNYMIPAPFFPLVIMGLVIAVMAMYPMLERKLTKDTARHNLLQRPRDAPVRTSLGWMGIGFLLICTLSGGNDIIALFLHISLNATTWAGRIGLLVVPPIFYFISYRVCLGLQRSDHAVLEHGIETGIIKRLPHGQYIEMHQPLGGLDEHGHAIPLEYQGAPVPKRMNKLGMSGKPVPGSLLRPDPKEETEALERARSSADGDGSQDGQEGSELTRSGPAERTDEQR